QPGSKCQRRPSVYPDVVATSRNHDKAVVLPGRGVGQVAGQPEGVDVVPAQGVLVNVGRNRAAVGIDVVVDRPASVLDRVAGETYSIDRVSVVERSSVNADRGEARW